MGGVLYWLRDRGNSKNAEVVRAGGVKKIADEV
jgi:hypothetical protein